MKQKKQLILPVAIGTTVLIASCGKAQAEEASRKYNILIIESDDHAYQMISAYDSTHIQTPNIDRIAEGGVRFNNSFVSNSISGPSRASLLTGKHSHANGFTNNIESRFDGSQMTFPKLLQAAGYQTVIFGKWHLHSNPTGFDKWEILPGQGDYYNPMMYTANDTTIYQGYATDIITDKGLSWLKEERDPDRPFLLMVQHKAAHRNWLPRLEDLQMYEDKEFDLPDTFYDTYEGRIAAAHQEMHILKDMDPAYDVKMAAEHWQTPLARGHQRLIHRLKPEDLKVYNDFYQPLTEQYWNSEMTDKERAVFHYQRYMRDYAKVVYPLDQGIGRILDYLEEEGLLENTIVIYTSDQGFYMGEHGWFDKRFMYEESFRTPLLMHLPKGLTAEGAINELVQNIDLAPTILELAGVAVPEEIQGVSLVPLLRGVHELPDRDALYYHFYEYPAEHMVMRHYGVRDERYKLIHFYGKEDFWELYDLQKDPNELHNYYNDPAYAEVVKMMRQKLVKLQTQYADTLAIQLNGF